MRLRRPRVTRNGIVPPDAHLLADDPQCRAAGHRGLRWTEETDHPKRGTTRVRIIEAECTDCGRPQHQVRVVYPSERVINVIAEASEPEPGDQRGDR